MDKYNEDYHFSSIYLEKSFFWTAVLKILSIQICVFAADTFPRSYRLRKLVISNKFSLLMVDTFLENSLKHHVSMW